MLRFSIEEAIAFRREHHVDQLLSISLQPTITIEEQEDYVYIRGVLELSGEYAKREEDGEDDLSVEAVRYVEHVRINDEQVGEFLHQFPIDVTVVKADYFFPKIAGLKFPRRTLLILLFFLLEPLFP